MQLEHFQITMDFRMLVKNYLLNKRLRTEITSNTKKI